jgi:hypothetical protein
MKTLFFYLLENGLLFLLLIFSFIKERQSYFNYEDYKIKKSAGFWMI